MSDIKLTSGDINTSGGGESPPCVGLAPDALPEVQKPIAKENLQKGVSTKSVLTISGTTIIRRTGPEDLHWYALRATYGREKKAYDFLVDKGVEAYYPTIKTVKLVNGKRKIVEESRVPNIFFAHGTWSLMRSLVYDTSELSFLRFYCTKVRKALHVEFAPIVVPDYQIETLRIICDSEADDVIIAPEDIPKFKSGQTVRVVEGAFEGAIGKVARYKGQQRVGIVIADSVTVATTYIPSAFLEKI